MDLLLHQVSVTKPVLEMKELCILFARMVVFTYLVGEVPLARYGRQSKHSVQGITHRQSWWQGEGRKSSHCVAQLEHLAWEAKAFQKGAIGPQHFCPLGFKTN